MEMGVSVEVATKMKEAMSKIDEAIDYIRKNVDADERAPLFRAVGEIFSIMNDEIYSRLVKANPELHDVLFGGLPRSAPDDFLRMAQLEQILPERKYKIGAEQVTVVARLGFPRPTKRDREWACSFQLARWEDGQVLTADGEGDLQALGIAAPTIQQWLDCNWGKGRIQAAHGVDGLQALTIAASAIRRWLDIAGNVSSSGAPYEFDFPRYVPFAHDLEPTFRTFILHDLKRRERELRYLPGP